MTSEEKIALRFKAVGEATARTLARREADEVARVFDRLTVEQLEALLAAKKAKMARDARKRIA